MPKKIPSKQSSTTKRKISLSQFPKSQTKLPSRKLPIGTAKIASRKIAHPPSAAKKKAVAPLPDRPNNEEERIDQIEKLKEKLKGMGESK